ncbi:MAG: hypothetical protein LC748_04160 [Thermomicrobia bacterium]|nr:hypothetical protein [Thermomicrobia bacterium]
MQQTAPSLIEGEDASYQPVRLDFRRLSVAESLARSRAFLDTMRERRSVRISPPLPSPLP